MKRLNNSSGYKFARIKTFLFIGMALLSAALLADTVNLPAEKDNTLYAEGDLSNGAGDHLFTGSTNAPSIRRAVERIKKQQRHFRRHQLAPPHQRMGRKWIKRQRG